MLLDPSDWSLAYRVEELLRRLHGSLAERLSPETHSSAVEIQTGPQATVEAAMHELRELRGELSAQLEPLGLRAAVAGVHPFAVWHDVEVTDEQRYRDVYGSMRELARREPTFALHIHVAIPSAEIAVRVLDRMRAHLPLLLALSANSPFWQGRDTGLASVRTPLFQAFPRVGIPRPFLDYADYVEAIDLLVRCDAIPDPSFLWWDVRLQPRFGTIEVRIMDAQTDLAHSAALVALVQSLVRVDADAPPAPERPRYRREVLDENRFLAARDGMEAQLLDADAGLRRPARELLGETLELCRPAAATLGCLAALESVRMLSENPGAAHQRAVAQAGDKLSGLVQALAREF